MPDQPRAKKSAKQRRPAGSGRKAKHSRQHRSLWRRFCGWLSLLFKRRRQVAEPGKPANKAAVSLARLRIRKNRTLAEWKQLRRLTTTLVKAHLAEQQPIPAIKKLTLALLEDPQHEPYHELLRQAVEQRHRRRLKPGEQDPWGVMAKDLRAEVVKLEALSAYVDELELLLDEAGVPTLASPVRSGKKKREEAGSQAGG